MACSSASSSMRAMPPDAVISRPEICNSSRYRAMLVPCIVPSREISVAMIACTPASAQRRQKATPGSGVTSFQPFTATRPSRMSTPTAILGPYFCAMRAVKSKSFTAMVPRMQRPTPRERYCSMRASSRMPPPTSINSPPCLAMAAMVVMLAVVSSLAPSKSTTCRYLAPAAINSRAWAAGSAL